MSSNKNYKYYVVEILDSQCKDFERYFCIPASWIQMKESDHRALVSFPLQEISVIKKWVKDGKEYSENWTVLAADIKYGADSYENASDYVTKLENRLLQEQSYAEIIKESEDGLSALFELKSPACIKNKDLELNESQEISSQQTLCTNLKLDIHKAQNETFVVGDATSDKMETLLQFQRDRQLPSEIHPEAKSNDSSYINNSSTSNLNAEDIIKFIFQSDFLDEFNKEYSSLEKFKNVEISQDCANMSSVMKKIIQLLDNYKKCYIDQPNVTILEDGIAVYDDERKNDTEIINEDVKTNATQEEQKSHDTNVIDDSINNDQNDKNVQQKTRYLKRFTLPKEYDENNSRWTLRHPEKKPGLIELIPHSGVYVDDIGLRNCISNSRNDERTFARSLLVEIFNDNALGVCSLTGRIAYPYRLEGYRKRPGLDEHARIVLFNYVEQYAREKNWLKLDDRSVTGSVRNKLRETRAKLCKN